MNRIANKTIKRKIFDFSYQNSLSHLGSCIAAVDIIEEIFSLKKEGEPFILSAGHAGVALYAVIESRGGKSISDIFKHHNNIHPDKCTDCGLDCTSGSLGHGLGISAGMALTRREDNIYVLVSDGELAEGSCYEALRFAYDQKLSNLKIYVNVNGWGAFGKIDPARITSMLRPFDGVLDITVILSDYSDFTFLNGLSAHYVTMDDGMYKQAMELLNE